MTDYATDKRRLRKEILARRGAIPTEERARRSALACTELERYFESKGLPEGSRVAVYYALGSEVDVHGFVARARTHGWTCAFPVMLESAPDASAQMTFWDVPARPEPRAFFSHPAKAICENDPSLADCTPVDPAEIDAVVAPLVAFDDTGMRLGYGGGNYDRLFAQLKPSAVVCGVAFAEQRAHAVPAEPHDAPLAHIVVA